MNELRPKPFDRTSNSSELGNKAFETFGLEKLEQPSSHQCGDVRYKALRSTLAYVLRQTRV